MPIVNLALTSRPDPARSAAIAATLTRLTAEILHKAPELTAVAIRHIAPEHWFVGGADLAGHGRDSFFLDILVTDETNTAHEKRDYIAAVYAAMVQLLGQVHEVSYVHVHDARAAAWGYGGETQQYRGVVKLLAARDAPLA